MSKLTPQQLLDKQSSMGLLNVGLTPKKLEIMDLSDVEQIEFYKSRDHIRRGIPIQWTVWIVHSPSIVAGYTHMVKFSATRPAELRRWLEDNDWQQTIYTRNETYKEVWKGDNDGH